MFFFSTSLTTLQTSLHIDFVIYHAEKGFDFILTQFCRDDRQQTAASGTVSDDRIALKYKKATERTCMRRHLNLRD